MQSLYWYVNRLTGMSAPEISARIGHAAMGQARRMGLCTARTPPDPAIRSTPTWLYAQASLHGDSCIEAAERVIAGKVSVFALPDPETGSVRQWNRDPLTGVVAPLRFGPSIDVHSQAEVGNIKYLWEPNRHLDLVVVAQAFKLTGDAKYLHGIRALLESWFDQCPYLKGPNWSSGLELAIRLINWSLVWQLIGAAHSPMFEGGDGKLFRDRWLKSIYQHVHFVDGHYSRFSSANNHLVGEAAGVFIASCTWPYWEDFEKWGENAKQLLVDAADEQTHADGVNREQAVSYQQFVLDFFILAALAGRGTGITFPDDYWKSVERMLEYVCGIMDVRGNVPMIGDADDGFAVRLSQAADFCPYRSLLATGAILFQRPDFAAKSGGLDDKTRFLLGSNGWAALSGKVAMPRAAVRRRYPEGGYYLLGDGFDTDKEIRMLIDAGPLGYLSIAAHGHADALAIWLSIAGREFLVDPGTYSYHGKPEWRRYFRGTRAHNTVVIDDEDQSVQAGNFMWRQHANARCKKFKIETDHETFIGEHDGYRRLDDPVTHERQIDRVGTRIEIVDTLTCVQAHTSTRCWHFSEQCRVSMSGSEILAENHGITMRLTANDIATEIICLQGSEEPVGGWVSRRFDVKTPSTSVFFVDRIEGITALSATIQCELGQ